jgi:hypothetical protein
MSEALALGIETGLDVGAGEDSNNPVAQIVQQLVVLIDGGYVGLGVASALVSP